MASIKALASVKYGVTYTQIYKNSEMTIPKKFIKISEVNEF